MTIAPEATNTLNTVDHHTTPTQARRVFTIMGDAQQPHNTPLGSATSRRITPLWMSLTLCLSLLAAACAGETSVNDKSGLVEENNDENDDTPQDDTDSEQSDPHTRGDDAQTNDDDPSDGANGANAPTPDESGKQPDDDAQGQAAPRALDKERQALDFMEYVVSHCLVDELELTEYGLGWRKWSRRTGFKPSHGPTPRRTARDNPPMGSAKAKRLAKKLRDAWLANPTSHVVDCYHTLTPRKCEHCRGKGTRRAHYIAYLPKEIITEPERVRSILMLVPGGNGGRTRYFLTPIPNKTIWDSMSGGLEVQRHTDEYLAEHPDHTPPIVVALNSGGWLTVNGNIEYQTHDMPMHIAETYLGTSDLSDIALGADGISSGSRSMMRAYAQKPNAHNTIGLTCMHCGGNKGGFQFNEDFIYFDTQNQIFDAWKARRAQGLFHIRFAIGNGDRYWYCNREIHKTLIEKGVLNDTTPDYENCRGNGRENPKNCDVTWDSFFLYDGQGHHYGLLLDSWVPSLRWHIGALHQSVLAMDRNRLKSP